MTEEAIPDQVLTPLSADAWGEYHRALDFGTLNEISAAREAVEAAVRAPLEAENARLLALINTPEINDFIEGVRREAAHQTERWGEEHDAAKGADDWFWLVGYVAGKALRAAIEGDYDKAKHHLITVATVSAQWHNRLAALAGVPKEAEGVCETCGAGETHAYHDTDCGCDGSLIGPTDIGWTGNHHEFKAVTHD